MFFRSPQVTIAVVTYCSPQAEAIASPLGNSLVGSHRLYVVVVTNLAHASN